MENIDTTGTPKAWQRRDFVTSIIKALSVAPLLTIPAHSFALDPLQPAETLTVQQVIDLILRSIPGAPFPKTVDTIKSGDSTQLVSGIVTTMFATNAVIEKAINEQANFIIAHEPTFYNHLDETDWLENDEVYKHKKDLLEKNKIVVWRFHDGIHTHKPDGVLAGVLSALEWQQYYNPNNPEMISIPATSLGTIITHVKDKLEIPHVKVIGDPSQMCTRIALVPGASGGRSQINTLQKENPDLMICGEINEWETAEYIRDLQQKGSTTSLIVTGHAVSEEPGLEWLVIWLQPQIPGIKISHIPSGDPFNWA
ncbi:MAG: Nif3-like dinuclear metal center hexameric protein [Ginsengibacter sp.]